MTFGQTYVYLKSLLAPIAPFLDQDDVTDIWCNQPNRIWLERVDGRIEDHIVPDLTSTLLVRLARQIASYSAQGITREHPLLAGHLPNGSRVQIAIPPATRGEISLSIRKHRSVGLALDEWQNYPRLSDPNKIEFPARPDPENVSAFLRWAVQSHKTILVSGGTSSGKTSLLNSLIVEIEPYERLILIEDTPELILERENAVGLLAVRGKQGESSVTADDLLIASLRMRPDRIILGEIRGSEAATFLRAVNTGHPGSVATIHANDPHSALDQLALLVLQASGNLNWETVSQLARKAIDIVVQVERSSNGRHISEILEM